MIHEVPYVTDDLEIINLVTGKIEHATVIGFAEDGSRILEGRISFVPLFNHIYDQDGDWIEIQDGEEELYGREYHDPNLMRYKS